MGGPAVPIPTQGELRSRIGTELAAGWELHVAIRDDRVVGMLALKPEVSVLDQIFVMPEEQGTGVGKALLDLAKQVMAGGFTLRMAASNDQALRFYQSQGLARIGSGLHPATGIPVTYLGWKMRAPGGDD